jgi:hypothetical protein
VTSFANLGDCEPGRASGSPHVRNRELASTRLGCSRGEWFQYGLRQPAIRGDWFSRNGFSPARHELTDEGRRVSRGKPAQHIGKRLERGVGRKIHGAQAARDDEPQTSWRAELRRRVEAGKQDLEQLRRSSDGLHPSRNRPFNEYGTARRQPDDVRGGNALDVTTGNLQHEIADDGDDLERPQSNPGSSEIGQRERRSQSRHSGPALRLPCQPGS